MLFSFIYMIILANFSVCFCDKSYNLKGFWYYILGSFILILFSTIGQIPILFFLDYDSVTVDTTSVDL